jgi:hypothetical protein
MALPSNLSFFMSRLQGVSTSHFKIFPQSSDTASSGKIIRFQMPNNSLVNMKNLRLFFNAATANATTNKGGRLPNDISSLIERVAIYMGGVLVQNSFNQYNTLVHAKSAIEGSKCDATLSHPEIVRAESYHNSAALTRGDDEGYTAIEDAFCISNWEGLLGSIEPSIIDTGLLPEITIEITLADDSVCSTCDDVSASGYVAGSSNVGTTYSLTNLSIQVEVLGMATSVLEQLTEQRIASVGYLSLPFKNYFTYQSTHTSTSRFNVNSASWDRLWVVFRPSTYSTQDKPQAVSGHKDGTGAVTYDTGGSYTFNTNNERYISNYFKFVDPGDTNTKYNLQVNSANVPAYKMSSAEALSMTKGAVDYAKNVMSLDQYRNQFFVQCYRFCLPDSDFNRLASGLDTRSVSAQGTLETTSVGSCSLTMFAECSSELRVGKFPCQQQVQVGA